MPSPPGPYYVFLQDDSTLVSTPSNFQGVYPCSSAENLITRHLGLFPTRAYADKYWRIIQGIKTGGPCRRVHPQYYIVPVLPNRLGNNPDWDPRSCLVRQLKNDCLPVIPPDQYPDNRNGASFYIRSTLHPKFYWYFNPTTGQVELSKTRQSRFTITRAGTPGNFKTSSSGDKDDILICEDMVALSVGYNGHRVSIVRGPENTMVPNNQPVPFPFGQFDQGFYGLYGKEEGLVCGTRTTEEVGERWEFVA